MTVPNGSIKFNNSTGSDTQASGLGPSTAIFGAGASLNSTSTVDLSADSPDLSGITAGDLLWVNTSSGRQFSIIASFDNTAKTVTCDDTFAVTESSRSWAIGGKRSSLTGSSNLFGANIKPGWTVDIEYTGIDYTVSNNSLIGISTSGTVDDGFIHITSSSGTKPTLSNTGNFNCIDINGRSFIKISNLKLVTDNTGSGYCISNNSSSSWSHFVIENCEMTRTGSHSGTGGGVKVGGNVFVFVDVKSCYIHGLSGPGIATVNTGGGNRNFCIVGCTIDSCQGRGIENYVTSTLAYQNIIKNNGADGIAFLSTGNNRGAGCAAIHNVSYNNSGDGISIGDNDVLANVKILYNIIVDNGAYGIDLGEAPTINGYIADYNAFYNNTSGARNNLSAGANDITLTGDPFVDAANGDFNINNTAGAGASLRAVTVTL